MATVTLDRIQRDGLHLNVGMCFDGLTTTLTVANEMEVKAIVERLPVCCALLDQIGWDEHGTKESYRLEVDANVSALAAGMIRGQQEYVADLAYTFELSPGEENRQRMEAARSVLAGLLTIAEPALEHAA